MITSTVLIILASLLLLAAVMVIIGHKLIAKSIYEMTFELSGKSSTANKSPYYIKRNYISTSNVYYIYCKNGNKATAEPFWSVDSALKSMNEIELLGNFELTKIGK